MDKALGVAQQHPDIGSPYPAQSTKILALLAVDRANEAQQLVDVALKQAATDTRRIKQVELLMMAATIARRRGLDDESLSRIEQAVQIAKAGGVQRLLGDAEAERSSIYRNRGDLARALEERASGFSATKAAGSRWELPAVAVQCSLGSSSWQDRGRRAHLRGGPRHSRRHDAERSSGSAQARLVGVMSDVYTGHFALVARQGDTNKAFAVLERARGRALADLMRSSSGVAATNNAQRDRAISQLQVRLLRAFSWERRRILSQLWDTEQSIGVLGSTNAKRSTTADERWRSPPCSGASRTVRR